MSTVAQLERFSTIIASENRFFKSAATNWPYIFMDFRTNLSAELPEPWAHKQDAWQALAAITFRALERGQITSEDLTMGMKQFLVSSAPFLVAVECWQQENSGSWEELEALRTSVLAWDLALLHEYNLFWNKGETWFTELAQARWNTLPAYKKYESVSESLADAMKNVSKAIAQQLPFESPQYASNDPRYREADAALLYLLENDTIVLLAQVLKKDSAWVEEQENTLLNTVLTLQGEAVPGIARYKDDSYQRRGFFRPSVVKALRHYYGSQSGDASGMNDFVKRGELVPAGGEALWTHFVWQIVHFAARRFQQTGNEKYKQTADRQARHAFSLVLTKAAPTLEVNAAGRVSVGTLDAWQIPECYIQETWRGDSYYFPSPHTPLNWSVREAQLAVAYLQTMSQSSEQKH